MSMKLTLGIDTSLHYAIQVFLRKDGVLVGMRTIHQQTNAQMALPLVEEILQENKLMLSDITDIVVNAGPGSFTGLRVGIAIATMLGKLLSVPVNGKLDSPVDPIYHF